MTNIIVKVQRLILICCITAVLGTPFATQAQTVNTTELSNSEKLELIQNLLSQITALQALLDAKRSSGEGVSGIVKEVSDTESEEVGEESRKTTLSYEGSYERKYRVRKDNISSRGYRAEEVPQDEELWELFHHLAGEEFVERYISEFWIYDNEEASSRAHVFPYWVSMPRWILALNVNGIDFDNEEDVHELINTYIHEIAHIVSLDRLQADHNEGPEECATHYVTYACLDYDSYLYEFMQEFWNEDLEYASSSRAMEDYYDKLELVTNHHNASPDDFVSVYAASDYVEDFAETFMTYTISSAPLQHQFAQDKISFINRYDRLSDLRKKLRYTRSKYLSEYYENE